MNRNLSLYTNISKRLSSQRDLIRKPIALSVVALLIATGLVSRVSANAGDLDASFGSGGIVITDFGFGARASTLLIQADGKLVVVGRGGPYDSGGFLLARYNQDGSLDASFGSGGYAIIDFGFGEDVAGAAIDASGRIVIAGMSDGDKIVLARYKADGNLDSTFGAGGTVVTPVSGHFYVKDMALQADGKIVVVGDREIPALQTGYDFVALRYTATGSLDSSFDGDGFLVTDFNQPKDFGEAVVIQNDGKIVVAGFTNPEYGGSFSFLNSDFCMARYKADGSLDPTFGNGGRVTSNFPVGTACQEAVLQSDGKIILLGFATNNGEDFALARYNANGSVDSAFGNSGLVLTDFGGAPFQHDRAFAAALQPDGKIVVSGSANGNFDSALVRYNSNGTLDTSFGTEGKVVTDIDESDNFVDVAVYGGGPIVTAAFTQHGIPQTNGSTQLVENFALARYQDGGTSTSADLAVAMSASLNGTLISYTITVNNYGLGSSYYVTLKDTLPANTTFVSFTAPPEWVIYSKPGLGQTGTVSVSKSKMLSTHYQFSSTATFTLVVRVNGAASGTTISNRVFVSSAFTADPYAANNRDIVYTAIP
jgi:uncharacterized delta-60 repeat protein/uncharacterized repeat protein (TIGR01451 family)